MISRIDTVSDRLDQLSNNKTDDLFIRQLSIYTEERVLAACPNFLIRAQIPMAAVTG